MEDVDYECRDYAKDVARLYRQINETKTLAVNIRYVDDFVSYLRARGLATATIAKHLNGLKIFFGALNPKVDLKKATREEVMEAMGKIESGAYSPHTKHHFRATVKFMCKQLQKCELGYYTNQHHEHGALGVHRF